jgi:hypothetical protein
LPERLGRHRTDGERPGRRSAPDAVALISGQAAPALHAEQRVMLEDQREWRKEVGHGFADASLRAARPPNVNELSIALEAADADITNPSPLILQTDTSW